MTDKIASIMDNKIQSTERTQTHPLLRRTYFPEQQNKYNEQIKAAVSEAKSAVIGGKYDSCIAKLDEGIDLIDQWQKLILIADLSEYGWKTVGKYRDNELADNDEDANKMRKVEKEAQRKMAETRATNLAKSRIADFPDH